MTDELHVKQQFESYEAFRICLDSYENETGYKFSVKNSQTIEKCKVKGPFKSGLIYYERHYRCQFAGKFTTKGAGIRNCRTIKTGCPAEIKFRARDKKCLEITKFESEHNHNVLQIAEDRLSYHPNARPRIMDKSAENPDDHSSIDEPEQQEDSRISLGVCEETSTNDRSKFDIENMTVVFQNSTLQTSDEPSASCSVPTPRTTSEVEHPTSPVDTPEDSGTIGEDLKAMLEYIDKLKGTPSDSASKTASENLNVIGIEHTIDAVEKTEKSDSFLEMKMSRARKGKGCPKGARLNAVGLPRRKNIPLQFSKKKTNAKAYDMLGWLFSDEVREAAYSCEYLLLKDDVELATQNLKDAFNDETVDIDIIKIYFEENASNLLKEAVVEKRKLGSWICEACYEPIVDDDKTTKFFIMCDNCLDWNHSHCVGLSRRPKSCWFCHKCSST